MRIRLSSMSAATTTLWSMAQSPAGRRKGLVLGLFSACWCLVLLMVYSDMSGRMEVINVSNEKYQQMLDRQTQRVQELEVSVREKDSFQASESKRYQGKESELKDTHARKTKAFETKIASLTSQLDDAVDRTEQFIKQTEVYKNKVMELSERETDCQNQLTRSESKAWQCENNQRTNLATVQKEMDSLKFQYSNLFKEHQQNLDTIQELTDANNRFQAQLMDTQKSQPVASNQFPPVVKQIAVPPSQSSSSKAPIAQGVLQQPGSQFHPHQVHHVVNQVQQQQQQQLVPQQRPSPPAAASSSTKIINNLQQPNQVVNKPMNVAPSNRVIQVNSEDVMEAPKLNNFAPGAPPPVMANQRQIPVVQQNSRIVSKAQHKPGLLPPIGGGLKQNPYDNEEQILRGYHGHFDNANNDNALEDTDDDEDAIPAYRAHLDNYNFIGDDNGHLGGVDDNDIDLVGEDFSDNQIKRSFNTNNNKKKDSYANWQKIDPQHLGILQPPSANNYHQQPQQLQHSDYHQQQILREQKKQQQFFEDQFRNQYQFAAQQHPHPAAYLQPQVNNRAQAGFHHYNL